MYRKPYETFDWSLKMDPLGDKITPQHFTEIEGVFVYRQTAQPVPMCGNCVHFEEHCLEEGIYAGLCKRYPPVPGNKKTDFLPAMTWGVWPAVIHWASCAEFYPSNPTTYKRLEGENDDA